MTHFTQPARETRILAFGEILWDMLPSGRKLGGAPVNFLYHAHQLGASVQALTKVGDDPLGREILARLHDLAVPTDFLQISESAPTGVVQVTLDSSGSPSYEIVEGVAWDDISIDDDVSQRACDFLTENETPSAFYFGSLALRAEQNRVGVERILADLPRNVVRVCDLNLRAPFYTPEVVEFTLASADVFKLNDEEALTILELLGEAEEDRATLRNALDDVKSGAGLASAQEALGYWAKRWRAKFNLRSIILTCGGHGAYLFDSEGVSHAAAPKVDVRDTVGAGDSFAAVCVVGLLQNRRRDEIVQAAVRRAAFVCGQEGATPFIPTEERDTFNMSTL